MKFLKGFVLVLLAIILFVVGWVYCVGMGAERTVLSKSYYQGIFDEVGQVVDAAYDALEAQLTEQLLEEIRQAPPGQGPPEEFPAILVASLIEAFPREWLREQVLTASDDILAWAKGQQELPAMTIDLRENKQAFRDALLANLEELAADLEMPPGGPEMIVEEIMGEIDLPDEVSLGELLAEEIPSDVEETLSLAQNIRNYFLYVPYILFALILLFNCLLAGIAGGLKWFGATILISGGILSAGLLTFQFALLTPVYRAMELDIPVAFDVIKAFAGFTVFRLATVPLIFAGAGLLLLVTGIVITKVKRKASE